MRCKRLVFVIGLLFNVGLLAGCSGGSGPGRSAEDGGTKEPPVPRMVYVNKTQSKNDVSVTLSSIEISEKETIARVRIENRSQVTYKLRDHANTISTSGKYGSSKADPVNWREISIEPGEKVEKELTYEAVDSGMRVIGLIMSLYHDNGFAQVSIMIGSDRAEQPTLKRKQEVTVFLSDKASFNQVAEFQNTIVSWPEVKEVNYISKEAALEKFKRDFKDKPEVLANVQGNPLPASFEIKIKNTDDADTIVKRIKSIHDIDKLVDDVNKDIKLR